MRTDWEHLRMVSASAISPVLAYYTPTKRFLLALVLAFALNIYAGMKADGVSFTCCENFSFGKFKNALAELVLYVVIICFLFTGMTANMMRMIFAIFYQSTYIMQRLAKSFFYRGICI